MKWFIEALNQGHPLITAGAKVGLIANNAWTPEHAMFEKMHQDVSSVNTTAFWFFWLAHSVFFGSSEEARCANKLFDSLLPGFLKQEPALISNMRYAYVASVDGMHTPLGDWYFEYPARRAMYTKLEEVARLLVFINAAWGAAAGTTQAQLAQGILLRGEWPADVRKPARISARYLLADKEHPGCLVGLLDGLDRVRDQVLDRLDPPMSLEDRVAEALNRTTAAGAVFVTAGSTPVGKAATPDKSGNDFKSLEID